MFTTIHMTMFVHDQDVTVNFYKNLGFVVQTDVYLENEARSIDNRRWLTLCLPHTKGFELVLMKATTEIERSLVGKQGGDNSPFLTLETNDCRKEYERLHALGIEILGKPEVKPWGICMYFNDNSGNEIYVIEHV